METKILQGRSILKQLIENKNRASSIFNCYLELSKYRLSSFVVLTSIGGYAMTTDMNMSTLLIGSIGTTLCAFSANSFNQVIEQKYDTLMNRTKNRVLPRKALTRQHALCYSIASGLVGTSLLSTLGVWPAFLGFCNIGLYALVYTPLKRKTEHNTEIGSLVGAIPPLMGYSFGSASLLEPAAWILPTALFLWQFPHFNALSYRLKDDYKRAGYRMQCLANPRLNTSISLIASLSTIPLTCYASLSGIDSFLFMIDGNILNAGLIYYAWKFHKNHESSRELFRFSLLYLPLYMILLLFHKNRENDFFTFNWRNLSCTHESKNSSSCLSPLE